MYTEIVNLSLEKDEAIAFASDLHADSHPPSSRLDVDYTGVAVEKLGWVFESCLKNKVKMLILGGDVFHRVVTTFECVRRIGSMFLEFKKAGIMVGSIVGNHDIARNQIEKLSKSPLNMLFDFGILENLNIDRRVVINKKLLITPVGYLEKLVKANKKAVYNILVAHMFYKAPKQFGDSHSLTEGHVLEMDYDAIFLGHDHINYKILRKGKTDIVRPGSLIRGTTHNYNFNRDVGFYILRDPVNYSVNNYDFIKLPARPMEEVVSSLVLHKKNNLADLSDMMGDLVMRLTESGERYDGVLDAVRKDKNIPESVRSLLLDYFREEGILISG